MIKFFWKKTKKRVDEKDKSTENSIKTEREKQNKEIKKIKKRIENFNKPKNRFIKLKLIPHTENYEYWGVRESHTFYILDTVCKGLNDKEIEYIEDYFLNNDDIQGDIRSEYELGNDEIEKILKGGKK